MKTAMVNNYYVLGYAGDTKVIGKHYPQVVETRGDDNALRKLYFSDQVFPEIDAHPVLILHKNALLTDFISTGFQNCNGYYVSDKVKKIISNHFSTKLKFYECLVESNGSHYQYHWMHITSLLDNGETIVKYLNFEKSYFFIGDAIQREIRTVKITSLEDYYRTKFKVMNTSDNDELVWLRHPCFHSDLLNYDLFGIHPFSTRYYISNKLAQNLIANNITGFMVRPAIVKIDDGLPGSVT